MVEVQTSEVDALSAPFLNNGLELFSICWVSMVNHTPSLADFAMETKVCTFEVDAIPSAFSLAQ
jgi:hypothetical protein